MLPVHYSQAWLLKSGMLKLSTFLRSWMGPSINALVYEETWRWKLWTSIISHTNWTPLTYSSLATSRQHVMKKGVGTQWHHVQDLGFLVKEIGLFGWAGMTAEKVPGWSSIPRGHFVLAPSSHFKTSIIQPCCFHVISFQHTHTQVLECFNVAESVILICDQKLLMWINQFKIHNTQIWPD
jgi:hypothetical protein